MKLFSLNKHAVRFSLGIVATFLAASAFALDLPVKNIKKRPFYFYKVEKNVTLDSVVNKLGISRTQILKYNPGAIDGLKKGMNLYFPVDEEGVNYGSKTSYNEYIVKPGDTLFGIASAFKTSHSAILALNPDISEVLVDGQTIIIPVVSKIEDSASDNSIVSDQVSITVAQQVPDEQPRNYKALQNPMKNIDVAICMPFMLEEKPGKAAVHATDFYKGFLLGIDSLSSKYGNPPIRIIAVDTENPEHAFNAFDQYDPILRKMNFLIAPDTPDRLEQLGNIARESGIYVFNPFQVRDTTYLHNPYMIQGNIPVNAMYDKVIKYFMDNLNGATPVFILNQKAHNDKQAFYEVLTAALKHASLKYKTLKYNEILTPEALINNLPPDGVNYLFIPLSGTLDEFKNMSEALLKYQQEAKTREKPGVVKLFGYPEYIRFDGLSLDQLKQLNTTFYSRFFSDTNSASAQKIRNSFFDRYGTKFPEGVPNQALYGFDMAEWILSLASQGFINHWSISNAILDNGSQMTYRLQSLDNGGFVNDAVYFITLSENADPKVEIY